MKVAIPGILFVVLLCQYGHGKAIQGKVNEETPWDDDSTVDSKEWENGDVIEPDGDGNTMILPGPDYGGKMIKMIQTVKVLWPDNVYPSSAALAKLKKLIPAGQKPKIFKSGGTTFYQYRKNGGYGTATKDFNSVNPTNVKTYTKGGITTKVGNVAEFTINVRTGSSRGEPTVEFFKTNDRSKVTKIRYM